MAAAVRRRGTVERPCNSTGRPLLPRYGPIGAAAGVIAGGSQRSRRCWSCYCPTGRSAGHRWQCRRSARMSPSLRRLPCDPSPSRHSWRCRYCACRCFGQGGSAGSPVRPGCWWKWPGAGTRSAGRMRHTVAGDRPMGGALDRRRRVPRLSAVAMARPAGDFQRLCQRADRKRRAERFGYRLPGCRRCCSQACFGREPGAGGFARWEPRRTCWAGRARTASPRPPRPPTLPSWRMLRRTAIGVGLGAIGAGGFVRRLSGPPPTLAAARRRRRSGFHRLCVRCGTRGRVCPSRIIHPDLGHGVDLLLTPTIRYDDAYCLESCRRCTEVCPSGALLRLALAEKRHTVIGLPHVDMNVCLLGDDCEGRLPTHCPVWTPSHRLLRNELFIPAAGRSGSPAMVAAPAR